LFTKNKIKEFLDSTDVSKWNKILILINKLIEKKGIEEVLPPQDLDRIRYFKKLFSKIKYDKYQYFLQTIKNIQI